MKSSQTATLLASSPTKSLNRSSVGDECNSNHKQLFTLFAYCLFVWSDGALEPLGGTLYNQLESQLNTSSANIAYILSLKAVFSAIGAIIGAIILQYVEHSHKYISIISIITAITISLCYYCKSLSLMFIIFSVIGYFIGTAFVSYPVYVLRLYPENQTRALFGVTIICGISKTLTPLIIDSSIYIFNAYGPFLNLTSVLLLILAILLMCWLPTPKHDELRNLLTDNTTMDNDNAQLIKLNERLNENKSIRYYSTFSLALLTFIMFAFSAFQSGTVNFIQKYMTNYLHKNENIARQLMSCYYFGQLFYRLMVVAVCKKLNPVKSLLISNFILLCIAALFMGFAYIIWPDTHSNIWLLYIIYVNIGIWASPFYPCILQWAELIQTVSGFITGLVMTAFFIGDAVNVTLMGTLIHVFGTEVVATSITGFIVGSVVLTVMAVIVFRTFSSIKNSIVQSL